MTSSSYSLAVQPRVILGKKTKKLRAQGVLPAHIFGDVKESIMIQVDQKQFNKMYKEAGETSVVQLQIEGEPKLRPVLIDEVGIDAMTGALQHVSFRQVDLSEKVTAEIDIEVVGELGVQEATIVLVRDVLEVEALPTDLPEKFTIDAARFTEIGQELTVKELEFDRSKVTLLHIEEDQVLAQVQAEQQMKEEVVEVVETVVGEGETPAATEEAAPAEEKKE